MLRTWLLFLSSLFCCLICGLRCFQFFKTKFQLLKISTELFALAAEDHPPKLLYHQPQMFDLLPARPQLLVLFH